MLERPVIKPRLCQVSQWYILLLLFPINASAELPETRQNIIFAKQLKDIRKELRQHEITMAEISYSINHTKQKIRQQRRKIKQLTDRQAGYQEKLEQAKKHLHLMIRRTNQLGENHITKLLLNQNDFFLTGRMLAYHRYYSHAHSQHIHQLREALKASATVQHMLDEEVNALKKNQDRQKKAVEHYTEFRQSRGMILQKMKATIQKQGADLNILQENQEILDALLAKLDYQHPIDSKTPVQAFAKMQGSLDWPVNGKLLRHFATPKKDGKLKWQGVLIKATSGENVQAISYGRVIFSDWFRNLGLLLIIDHGDDYMSLYGHNQLLLKQVGDRVKTGEVIAHTGDSGGQNQPGLYFEIRKNGEPVNPVKWCH